MNTDDAIDGTAGQSPDKPPQSESTEAQVYPFLGWMVLRAENSVLEWIVDPASLSPKPWHMLCGLLNHNRERFEPLLKKAAEAANMKDETLVRVAFNAIREELKLE